MKVFLGIHTSRKGVSHTLWKDGLKKVACVLVLLQVMIMQKIVVGFHIDQRFQVNLLEGLHIYNTTIQGLKIVEGLRRSSPAVYLGGEHRSLKLSQEVLSRVGQLLSQSNEFTFLATLKQDPTNSGTIIAFSEGNNRFLELQSSGRKDELRLHYSHQNTVHIETFPYLIADGTWHEVAMTVSGKTVDLYVDCNRIYRRVIYEVNRNFTARNISLWLGQRNLQHFLYKGSIQDVKIVVSAHGYLVQCPRLDVECPTCGQFSQLQASVQKLERDIKHLTFKLAEAEEKISEASQCECHIKCVVNGTIYSDGATWENNCEICSCVQGNVKCRPVRCPPTFCKNPVRVPGACCPICLKQCLLDNIPYDHGEIAKPKACVHCQCKNGVMDCKKLNASQICPELTCEKSLRFRIAGECCPRCPGMDYCSEGHNCHHNATCVNLDTRYSCQCNPGYKGDGRVCRDVDECTEVGGHDGHHCHLNTKCKNIPGSYVCECLPGYKRLDAFNCIEHNECSSSEHNCDKNAICINTVGSYKCVCKDGYEGDGKSCWPICNHTCLNGGYCSEPGVCTCRKGYTGAGCEIDVDECALGLHQCHPNSRCVNMPGWYYCECAKGYESHYIDNHLGILCKDIDECQKNLDTCHPTSVCINEEGSYRCSCDEDNKTCSLNCIYDGVEKENGADWTASNDLCSECGCEDGVVTCEKKECDCDDPDLDLTCCGHCDVISHCQHQEMPSISFKNGDRWIYQCQTCECMFGEIDCWEMECPPVECAKPVHEKGDCCPRCEDDPCSATATENGIEQWNRSYSKHGCTYLGKMYQNGEKVPLKRDSCASCRCKVPFCDRSNGHLCCTFSTACLGNTTHPHSSHKPQQHRLPPSDETFASASTQQKDRRPWNRETEAEMQFDDGKDEFPLSLFEAFKDPERKARLGPMNSDSLRNRENYDVLGKPLHSTKMHSLRETSSDGSSGDRDDRRRWRMG